jgi:hypothetical protein
MRYALSALPLVAAVAAAAVAAPPPAAAQPAKAQASKARLARCMQETLQSEGGRVASVVADPTLSVRSEPSLEATIMTLVPDGAPIIVLRREDAEWLQVIAVDATPGCVVKLGYVMSAYVR